jgi:hypothetical protein
MASTEIRNKDATVQIKVDGQALGGTMLAIKGFNLKSDTEMMKKRFTGDKRFRGDLDVKGYDFTFKTEKRDHIWWSLWKKIEQAEFAGVDLPVITLAITYAYRDGTGLLKTVVLHGDLILKMSGDDIPEGYQEVSWEGICSFASGN